MNYEDKSKEELIQILNRRDSKRKLGLVWERDEIEHDKALNQDFVALSIMPELSVGKPGWNNLIIEGENFDALRFLNLTLKGKVACIFIDPPYNTGNKDFIFNDRFVDKNDIYKHSKWLEYMYRRLLLARDLLRDDGVIFVNIGDEEFGNLSMLMEMIFPGKKVSTFVWKRREGASDEAGYNVSVDHEYVICYANPGFSFAGRKKDLNKYSNPDNDPRGPWMSSDLTKGHSYLQRPKTYYPIYNPNTDIWYPANPHNVWRFATKTRLNKGQFVRTKTIEQLIDEGKILFPENDQTVVYSTYNEMVDAIRQGTAPTVLQEGLPDLEKLVGKTIGYGRPRYKRHQSEMKSETRPVSTWIYPSSEKPPKDEPDVNYLQCGMTREGTQILQQIMGYKAFDYPKPLSLIKNLILQSTSSDGEDIILDFFAGSGTTGHAVLEANLEDDGNRRFVLVSSTEATGDNPDRNICRTVTRERLAKVINGYQYTMRTGIKTVEGIGGNYAYGVLERMPPATASVKLREDQIWIALQMLHQLTICPFNETENIQTNKRNNELLVYVSTVHNTVISNIEQYSAQYSEVVVYSWQPGMIKQRILSPNTRIEKIPEYLLDRFGGDNE